MKGDLGHVCFWKRKDTSRSYIGILVQARSKLPHAISNDAALSDCSLFSHIKLLQRFEPGGWFHKKATRLKTMGKEDPKV